MREIKFRAWSSKGEPKMIQLVDGKIGGRLNDLQEEDDWKVMQYTGLKDKNGVEIYEGDIVNTKDSNSTWIVGYEAPKFIVTVASGGIISELYSDLKHEVIGNIYESPDLLK